MSTWRELYDDFRDKTTNYTEKLTVTPKQFMRYISQGIQSFQKDTRLMEALKEIPRAVDNSGNALTWFVPPFDLSEIVEIKDEYGHVFFSQEYGQYSQNIETSNVDIPFSYAVNLDYEARIFTMFARQIMIYPDYGETTLYMRYVPNLDAYSSNSPMWSSWFPEDNNFEIMFNGTGFPLSMREWEVPILEKTISDFIRRQGSQDWQFYDKSYKEAVLKCSQEKPTLYSRGQRNYNMAPWS